MQENHRERLSFVQTTLPWVVAGVALLLYIVTVNRWVTLESLPFVAKVAGWDWTLPFYNPLFFLLSYPIRWLPGGVQPLVLNLFTAVCAALALGLLARSVALLPHDRTHEQRLRERSEFSLLSIGAAWVPPVLAALVCGLELTYWEHATAATNEALDLLLFAYVIRCLLEYRIDPRESWLTRMAFVYGLGVTNNFAMIGFFPCVLVAVLWIKGKSFFDFRFFTRMALCGLLGLSLYLLLPLAWGLSDNSTVSFGQALRAELVGQKVMLFNTPGLRTRVLILSLTSVLPLLVIGIRWPATFGDASPAGAAVSSVMFRVTHTVFLAACIWVAFDQQFSPRVLGYGMVAFLTFYYLGALSVGYFSGYLLLIFGESSRSKSRHRSSGLPALLNKVVVAAVWIALIAVPTALVMKNSKSMRVTNGPALQKFTEASTRRLPAKGALVLSDDPYGLLLLSASLSRENALNNYVLVHTRSLPSPDYHQQLHKRYPTRWPNFFTNQPPDEVIDDGSLLKLVAYLSQSNQVYYLHPSFGYYFEQFYMRPHGLVYELAAYPTNNFFPPLLTAEERKENEDFWNSADASIKALVDKSHMDSRDGRYIRANYSRALNYWGAALQSRTDLEPATRLQDAGRFYQLALDLNTNNVPASSNLEYNKAVRTGLSPPQETAKSIDDKFGVYRGWEPMLLENGPFDQPDFCLRLGEIFSQQGLLRQAAIQLDRVRSMQPTNVIPQMALADVLLRAQLPAQALDETYQIRAKWKNDPLSPELEAQLVRIEATAQFGLHNTAQAEKILQDAFKANPKNGAIADPLLQIYAQTDRLPEALTWSEHIIEADPDRPQAYINQAMLYLRQKDPDKAMESINRVLKKRPQQPETLLYKIFLLIQKKDFAGARSTIDALLSVDPNNADALLYKGVIEIETKNYAAALPPLDQLLKRQPKNADAVRDRALAHLQMDDLKRAEADYNTMRHLVTRDLVYVAYYGLGEIAYKRGDSNSARRFYTLYLQYAPQSESPELKEEKRIVTDRLQKLK